jgi:hypothetical protein
MPADRITVLKADLNTQRPSVDAGELNLAELKNRSSST